MPPMLTLLSAALFGSTAAAAPGWGALSDAMTTLPAPCAASKAQGEPVMAVCAPIAPVGFSKAGAFAFITLTGDAAAFYTFTIIDLTDDRTLFVDRREASEEPERQTPTFAQLPDTRLAAWQAQLDKHQINTQQPMTVEPVPAVGDAGGFAPFATVHSPSTPFAAAIYRYDMQSMCWNWEELFALGARDEPVMAWAALPDALGALPNTCPPGEACAGFAPIGFSKAGAFAYALLGPERVDAAFIIVDLHSGVQLLERTATIDETWPTEPTDPEAPAPSWAQRWSSPRGRATLLEWRSLLSTHGIDPRPTLQMTSPTVEHRGDTIELAMAPQPAATTGAKQPATVPVVARSGGRGDVVLGDLVLAEPTSGENPAAGPTVLGAVQSPFDAWAAVVVRTRHLDTQGLASQVQVVGADLERVAQ